jgi:cytochrome c oxidase subunit 1
MLWSARYGDPVADADPWNLKETGQFTREWQWFERRLESRYGIETPDPPPEDVRLAATTTPDRASPTLLDGRPRTVALFVEDAITAVAGGAAGLLLMGPVLATAVVVGVLDPSAFGELADLVGLGDHAVVGAGLFIVGGLLTWPLLFTALFRFLPGSYRFVSGIWFSTITVPGFVIAFYTGQSGLALVGYLGFVLAAHWAYGFGLGFVSGLVRNRWIETEDT